MAEFYCGSEQHSSKHLDKICELVARLKVVEEENRLLRREVNALKLVCAGEQQTTSAHSRFRQELVSSDYSGSMRSQSYCEELVEGCSDHTRSVRTASTSASTSAEQPGEQIDVTIKSLTTVTCNQERRLNSLRHKVKARREEMKEKDSSIASLKQEVRHLKRKLGKQQAESKTAASSQPGPTSDVTHPLLLLEKELAAAKLDLQQKEVECDSLTEELKRCHNLERKLQASSHHESQLLEDLSLRSNRIVELVFELEEIKDKISTCPTCHLTLTGFGGSFASFADEDEQFPYLGAGGLTDDSEDNDESETYG